MDLKNVLFICHGNINRSAAAELIWKKEMGGNVKSAGFGPSKKPMSKKMRITLQNIGFEKEETENHRSKTVDQKLMNWATAVFCMTPGHTKKLIQIYPNHVNKIYLLPSLIGKDRIFDPGFSSGIKAFETVLADIQKSISTLKPKSINKYPFVIVSKGRAGHAPFISSLEKLELPYILTLEKGDIKNYTNKYNHIKEIIELEKSDQGVGYCRHHTLKYMKKNYGGWFWKFDDDFTKFSRYNIKKRKFEEISFQEFISKGNDAIDHYKHINTMAMIGYRQTPFAINEQPTVVNTRLIQLVAINSDLMAKHKLNYDVNFIAMSDEDLTIRTFLAGLSTVKINHYMYKCPYSGPKKQIGGLDYKKTPKIIFVKKLVEKHKGIVKIISEDGGRNGNPQYAISWGKIKPKIPEGFTELPTEEIKIKRNIRSWL